MAMYKKKPKRDADGNKILDGSGVVITELIEIVGEDLALKQAELSAPKVKRREGEFREFLATFTDTEQAAIKTAAMNPSNVALALWYDKALGGATMSLDHSETNTGLSALVAAGLITSERKTAILATDFDLV